MAGPSVKRKPSGPVPTKFYDGPTVSKQAKDAGRKAGEVAGEVAGEARKVVDAKAANVKQTSEQLVRSARRHAPRNHTFFNAFILALTLLSLLTLRFCPDTTPPTTAAGRLNPFARAHPAQPAWERALCSPTQTYRRAILEPYIVPRVKARIEQVERSAVWKSYAAPALRQADSVYVGTIRPRLPVIQRALASLGKRIEAALRPYTAQVARQRDTLVARAQPYTAQLAAYRSQAEGLLAHPAVTGTQARVRSAYAQSSPVVRRYAAEGSRRWERDVVPRARAASLRAIDELERVYHGLVSMAHELYHAHVHHHVRPHLAKATTHSQSLFPAHLAERVQRAAPALLGMVMTPSLTDIRAAIRGGAESVGSSAQAVKDAVAASAGGAMDKTAQAKDAYVNPAEEESYLARLAAKAQEVKDRVVPVPVAQAAETPAEDSKMSRKHIAAMIDDLQKRVAAGGKAQRARVDAEIKKLVDTHRRKTVPSVLSQRVSSIQERAAGIAKAHAEYLGGLDVAADASADDKRAERARIEAISQRTRESLRGLRDGLLKELEEGLIVRQPVDASREEITRAVNAVLGSIESDLRDLGHDMTWTDSATSSDWIKYQTIEKNARGLSVDCEAILEKHMQPLLSLQSATTSEINSLVESYLIKVKTAEKNALNRLNGGADILPVDLDGVKDAASGVIGKSKEQVQQALVSAGVAVGASHGTASASSAVSAGTASASSASKSVTSAASGYVASASLAIRDAASSASSYAAGTASAQSVAEGYVAAASSAVRDAASSASSAIVGTPSVDGYAASASSAVKEAALSASSAGSGTSSAADYVASASSAIKQAASSASSAVVGTTSAAGYVASASSVINAAASSASSVIAGSPSAQGYVAAAQSAAQNAASSASSAMGGTAPAQSIGGSIASVASQASASAASVAEQASSAYHSATRSVGKAVGATPSADSIAESIEDAVSIASKSASSLASVATDSAASAASVVSASASSLASDAASAIHQATRSASSYVGATPTPESLAEHAESISAAAGDAASTVVAKVREGASSASSLAADATDRVKQVVRDEL